jgi:hypothetical protein
MSRREQMPVLYTKKNINDVLKELSIKTIDGRVDAEEAARILSWRAKHERQIEHTYTPGNIRKHRSKLDPIHPLKEDGSPNTRANLYPVEKVFDLDIEPQRTNPGRKK